MHVETVDAAPLTFVLDTNPPDTPQHVPTSVYAESIMSHPSLVESRLDEDNDVIHAHGYLPPDVLKHYLHILKERTQLTIPPVGKKGLPPLESLNIPQLDDRYKANPTAAQQQVLRAEALRGHRYLLSYLKSKLNYESPKIPILHPLSTQYSNASTISSSAVAEPDIPKSTVIKTNGKSVFSRLKKKVSLIVTPTAMKPPSPVFSKNDLKSAQSPVPLHSRDSLHDSTAESTQHSVSLSPSSTFSLTHSIGSQPLINNYIHNTQPNKGLHTPPINDHSVHSLRSFDTRTSLSAATSFKKLRNKTSFQEQEIYPIRQIKRSDAYIHNMGTLKILGRSGIAAGKRPFEVIIDPSFPVSCIDMDAILRETSHTKSGRDFLAASFQVVATPAYVPESPDNRVVIEIELIPLNASQRCLGIARRQSIEEDLIPDFSRIDFNSNVNFAEQQLCGYRQEFLGGNTFDRCNSKNASTASIRSVESVYYPVEGLALEWYLGSREIINLMDIRPYTCILGSDWLTQLSVFANRPLTS